MTKDKRAAETKYVLISTQRENKMAEIVKLIREYATLDAECKQLLKKMH